MRLSIRRGREGACRYRRGMTASSPVLITGCSSGIGAATAELLNRAGYTVYATARRPETLSRLADQGCRVLGLDVTSEDSMRVAVDTVLEEHGRVGALVNNAGYGEYAPIEEADLDRVRTMFETNVFGLSRMVQLVLPSMRDSHAGTIVNISSMGGRFAFPVGGFYHASKYAVEAISDSLRVEVAPFGIAVVVVEPGMIRTGFEQRVSDSLDRSGDGRSPYAELVEANRATMARSYASRLRASTPERVANVVLKALGSDRPRSRYVTTPLARTLIGLRRFGGDRVWDATVRQQFRAGG